MKTSMKLPLTVLALALTVAILWWTNRSVTPRVATLEDVRAEAEAGGYQLISTQELRALSEKNPGGLLLVDTRQEWEYRSGHIKGALSFPMEPTWFARWSKRDELREFLGPDRDRLIVFY